MWCRRWWDRQPTTAQDRADAPAGAHQKGFCKVVLRVPDGDVLQAVGLRPVHKERIAHAPRLIGQVAGAIPALPLQGIVRDAKPGADLVHLCRLSRGTWAQPVIDGDRGQAGAARMLPVVQKMQERQRIAAAGHRHAQSHRDMPREMCLKAGLQRRGKRGHEQPRRPISDCAEETAAAVG